MRGLLFFLAIVLAAVLLAHWVFLPVGSWIIGRVSCIWKPCETSVVREAPVPAPVTVERPSQAPQPRPADGDCDGCVRMDITAPGDSKFDVHYGGRSSLRLESGQPAPGPLHPPPVEERHDPFVPPAGPGPSPGSPTPSPANRPTRTAGVAPRPLPPVDPPVRQASAKDDCRAASGPWAGQLSRTCHQWYGGIR